MTTNKSPDIEQKVVDVIAEVCAINKSEITGQASLQEDLGLDSVDIVSLVLTLEDEFGGTISDQEMEKLRTVGDVIAFIDTKQTESE